MSDLESPVGDDSTVPCPICGESIHEGVKKCRHCGEWIDRNCEICNTPIRGVFAARGFCVECAESRNAPPPVVYEAPSLPAARKSKGVAMLLAFFLGGLGVHRFYLNRPGSGLLYLIFCWTFIPALFALVEVFRLAFMSDRDFQWKYAAD